MKNLILLSLVLLLTCGLGFAQEDRTDPNAVELVNGPKIEFVNTVHDFGEGPQGKPVATDFVFKNTGNAPLVLQNVKASCGCTTPFWPKEPIMPGQESKISAKYNMARAGNFSKTITVTVKPQAEGDTPETVRLTIKGIAVATPQENSVDEARPSIITNPNID